MIVRVPKPIYYLEPTSARSHIIIFTIPLANFIYYICISSKGQQHTPFLSPQRTIFSGKRLISTLRSVLQCLRHSPLPSPHSLVAFIRVLSLVVSYTQKTLTRQS